MKNSKSNFLRREDFRLYQEGVRAYLKGDLSKVHDMIGRTSKKEACLLKVRTLIRKQKWKEAMKSLYQYGAFDEPFLKAEQDFLTATLWTFHNDYERAAVYNLRAYQNYQKIKDRRGQFLSLYNLSVDYSRLGLLKVSDEYLDLAKYKSENFSESGLVLRAKACQLSKRNQYQKACQLIRKAYDTFHELPFGDQWVLDSVAVDIYFRSGFQKEAFQILTRLRNCKANREKARVEFEYQVLKAYLNQSHLPKIPQTLIHVSEWYLKWNILKAIETGNLEKAQETWGKLCDLYPQSFKPSFEFVHESDRHSIFGTYLFDLKTEYKETLPREVASSTKLSKLYEALSQSEFPLRKEELIESIWQTSYDPDLDSRFYKLMERFKKKTQISVVCINQAYTIQKSHDHSMGS